LLDYGYFSFPSRTNRTLHGVKVSQSKLGGRQPGKRDSVYVYHPGSISVHQSSPVNVPLREVEGARDPFLNSDWQSSLILDSDLCFRKTQSSGELLTAKLRRLWPVYAG